MKTRLFSIIETEEVHYVVDMLRSKHSHEPPTWMGKLAGDANTMLAVDDFGNNGMTMTPVFLWNQDNLIAF